MATWEEVLAMGPDQEEEQEPELKPRPKQPAGTAWERVLQKGEVLASKQRAAEEFKPATPREVATTLAAPVKAAGKAGLRLGNRAALGISSVMEGLDEYQKSATGIQLFNPERMQYFQDTLLQQAEREYNVSEHTQEAIAQGQGLTDPLAIAEQSLDIAAQVGFMLASGGTGAAVLAMSEAGGSREEIERSIDPNDPMRAHKASAAGAMVGLTSYALNRLTLGQWPANEAMYKVAQGAVTKQLVKASSLGRTLGPEAIEEMATGAAHDVARWAFANDKEAFEGFLPRRLQDGVFGVIGAGMARGVQLGGQKMNRQKQKAIQEIEERITKLAETDEGQQKLADYAAKEQPSRSDLAELGIKAALNKQERAQLAVDVDPAVLQSLKHFVGKAVGVEDAADVNEASEDLVLDAEFAPHKPVQDLAKQQAEAPEGFMASEEGTFPLSSVFGAIKPGRHTRAMLRKGLRSTIGLQRRPGTQEIQDESQRRVASKRVQIYGRVARLHDLMRKESQGDTDNQGISDNLTDLTDKALHGDEIALAQLPDSIKKELVPMREDLDALSRESLNSGAVTDGFDFNLQAKGYLFDTVRQFARANNWGHKEIFDELVSNGLTESKAATAAQIILNEGGYITRTYRAHTDPKWRERIPEDVRQDFDQWLAEDQPKLTEAARWRLMNELLDAAYDAGNLDAMWDSGKLSTAGKNILKARKDLPEQMRAFLGEIKSPIENYVRTANNLFNLIENYRRSEQIVEAGLKHGYLWHKDTPPNQIPAEATRTIDEGALKNYVMTDSTRDRIEALRDGAGLSQKPVLKQILMLEGFFQRMNTVWSSTAHMRQFVGDFSLLAGTGNVDGLRHVLKSVKVFRQKVSKKAARKDTEYLEKLALYGLDNDSVSQRELIRIGHDQDELDAFIERVKPGQSQAAITKLAKKTVQAPKWVDKKAQQWYGAMDTVFKVAAWEAEKTKQRWADPKRFPKTPEGDADLEAYTADIVRKTMPSYDRLPQAIQALRNTPISMYSAFPTSLAQNVWHRFRIASAEMANPNKRIQAIGLARLTSAVAAASAVPAALEKIAGLLGWDDEKMAAMHELAPAHASGGFLAPHWKNPESNMTKVSFTNLGYVDPTAYFVEPLWDLVLNPYTREEDVIDRFRDAAREMYRPFTNWKFGWQAVIDWKSGRNQYDFPLFDENDDDDTKSRKIAEHMAKLTITPKVVEDVLDLRKGMEGYTETWGKSYNPGNIIMKMGSGFSIEEFDVQKKLESELRKYDRAADGAIFLLNHADREGNVPAEEVLANYNRAQTQKLNAFERAMRKYKAATTLNTDMVSKAEGMGGLKEEELEAIRAKKFIPAMPTKIVAIDRLLEVVPENDPYRDQLEAQRDDVILKEVRKVVQANQKPLILDNARKSLQRAGITPEEQFQHFTNGEVESAIKARMTLIKNKTDKDRKKRGLSPMTLPEQTLRLNATRHVQNRIQEGDFWNREKYKTRTDKLLRLGLPADRLQALGFSQEDIQEATGASL